MKNEMDGTGRMHLGEQKLIWTRNFSEEQHDTHFWPQKKWRNFGTLKVEPADQRLRRYKSNCLRHVTRMNSSRMAKTKLNYRTNGRRRLGRPLKRLLDEAETGLLRPNWWRIWWWWNSHQVCVGNPAGNSSVGKWGRGGYYIIKHLKEKRVRYGRNSFLLQQEPVESFYKQGAQNSGSFWTRLLAFSFSRRALLRTARWLVRSKLATYIDGTLEANNLEK
jgi:hypothetical protein